MKSGLAFLACALLTPAAASAAVISDDFNDGNDTGWTRANTIGLGSYTFPGGNTYRLATTAASGTPLNPGRTGSFRNDASESAFSMSVDLVDWDTGQLEMVFGLLARVNQVGLGTTDGYALTIDQDEGISLIRITNEAPTGLGAGSAAPLVLNIANDYRLTFSGNGSSLTGAVYNLNNLAVPLATVSATDATYASGVVGMFVFDSSAGGTGTAAATVDNFNSVPEPSSALLGLGAAGLGLMIRRRRRS